MEFAPSDVARRAGIVTSSVQRIEASGKCTMDTFFRICSALVISPSTLMRRAELLAKTKPPTQTDGQ
jgi:DNA-binding Xre family transcriptional regulator